VASLVESQGYAGDEGNFEALYSTYRSDVQRLAAYLLKNSADAEDASQTVFMNVLRALRQGVRPAEPRAWLMAITRNVCFSRRRAVSCRPAEVELDLERAPEALDADAPTVEDIVGALSRMLPNQRTALILRDFRGAAHGEICELLTMSPAGVETLLTRARSSFREEIEAGDQPFECAETRALVEQQLAGEISVAERHSLRTHLRHCAPCSTLARAVRSSKGKLAGLVLWPVDLFQRLASALSQASSAVHVAAAVTSTAAIATVAIPVVMTHVSAASSHVEGRTAPGPAAVAASHETTAAHTTAPATAATSVVQSVSKRASHVRTHAVTRSHSTKVAKHAKTGASGATARAAAGASVALAAATPAVQSVAPSSAATTAAPVSSIVHPVSPHAAAPSPAVTQPVAVSPRSPSPAVKPGKATGHAKKSKPKPAGRHKPVEGRHPTDPADKPPASSDPLASLPTPSTSGPAANSGGGVTMGSDSTNSTSQSTNPSSSSSSSQGSSPGQSSSTNNGTGSNGNSGSNGDNGNGHKKPKHGH
jgi:RNA polymerase sigma factor (sigma-70 family)